MGAATMPVAARKVKALSTATHGQRRSVSVSLDPSLIERLDEEARRQRSSRSELLNRLVWAALEEEEAEDALLADIAERADLDPENQERIPWEQVRAESRAAR